MRARSEVKAEGLHKELVALADAHQPAPKKKLKRAAWDPEKKVELAKELRDLGSYDALKRRHAEKLPPPSTVYGWVARLKCGLVLHPPGRPGHLTKAEEDAVVKAMTYLRNKGVCVDRELLTALGRQTISKCRNIPMDKVQQLSEHWVKSMRYRHKFTRSE